MKMVASLVILNWKRPDNLVTIINRQSQYDCISDIVIMNNNVDVPFLHTHPKVSVLNASKDFGLHSRWSAGVLAKTPVILFQDDDILLPAITILRFIESIHKNPKRVYGIIGRNFDGKRYRTEHVDGECDIILTRAVAIHRNVLPKIISEKNRYLDSGFTLSDKNSDDLLLSYASRYVLGTRPTSLCLPWKDLPAPHALSSRLDHYSERTRVCKDMKQFFAFKK